MPKAWILIVEDEAIVREDLRDLIESMGYGVAGTAAAGAEAITKAGQLQPNLVLMDIQLKGEMDGIEAARRIREQLALPVVFLTAFVDEKTIARAAVSGPYGYLTKPFNEHAIRATIEVALHRHREERRPVSKVIETAAVAGDTFHGIVGRSAVMRELYEDISRVAQVNATVLIEGETGTGKERVARAIHRSSQRGSRPFITVNCAGLTETLVASELFGHRRGAFTGAMNDHSGLFEAAEGGTIFLDEIGDVPKSQQPFLLRVLEEREVTRVGESKPRKINVRVLAASNRNLEEEVAAGRFRSDLFYRVRVARITVSPLRCRLEDAPLLARHFLTQLGGKEDAAQAQMSEEVCAVLRDYPWPGNVRELKNAMEFAAIHCRGGVIHATDLPPEIQAISRPSRSPEDDRQSLLAALQAANGNRTEAARRLGISRATFYRRLGEAEIPADDT